MNQQLDDYIKQSRQRGKTDDQIRQELLGAGWDNLSIEQVLSTRTAVGNNSRPIFSKNNLVAIILGTILGLIPTMTVVFDFLPNPILLAYRYIFKGLGTIVGLTVAEAVFDFSIGFIVAFINKAKSYSVIWITGILSFVILRVAILLMEFGTEDLVNNMVYPLLYFFVFATLGYFVVKGILKLRRN